MYKLILVDDESLSLKILSKFISSLNSGFEIADIFDNSQDAISYLHSNHVDLIISDISMPGMNGLEFLEYVENHFSDIVFILLTGYKNFEYIKFAISHNAAEYLTKPVNKEELLSVLKKTKDKLDKLNSDRNINYSELLCQQALIDYISKKTSSPQTLFDTLSEIGINISDINTPIALIHTNIKNIDSVMCHFRYGADRLHTALIQIFRMNNIPVLSINYSISSMNIILFSNDENFENEIENILSEYKDNCLNILSVDLSASVTGTFSSIDESTDAILKMLNISRETKSSDVKNEHIKAALTYIDTNYKNDLSLEEVANSVHLTTYHFSKLFKSTMGTNYVNYITSLRVQKAQDMLLDTFMSVTEIGKSSGFSSTNNFFRVFKKITGMSPQQYRNTQVKNPKK